MSEGNETSDVWGRTAGIDEGALSVMAARLESRAKHDGRSTRGVLSLYVVKPFTYIAGGGRRTRYARSR
jgi:hypothetical protein